MFERRWIARDTGSVVTLLQRPRLANVSADPLQLIAHDREQLMAEAVL